MQDAMGIILTDGEGTALSELSEVRTMAALPIGGRYRLIDFVLSGMANSGITNVVVAPKCKYASLLEHLGAGSPWDLQRENDGLCTMPPYAGGERKRGDMGEMDVLTGLLPYLKKSRPGYVVLAKASTVLNITFGAALAFHKEKEADVTVLCHAGGGDSSRFLVAETEKDGRVKELLLYPHHAESQNFGMDMYIFTKSVLIELLEGATERGACSFLRDILMQNQKNLRMYAFLYEGYVRHIDSTAAYFACNMEMLGEEVQTALFGQETPIFTKVKNRVPTRYGEGALIHTCLVADGCLLEGSAENCIFFRGAKLGRRAHIKNCIVMEKTCIDVGCRAENVIFDKAALLREGRTLRGTEEHPVVIRKGAII